MRMWWNGRHDSFRSYWRQLRGGSTPLIRTIRLAVARSWPSATILALSCVIVILILGMAHHALAQATNQNLFKLDARYDDAKKQVVITAQNPPAGYTTFLLARDQSGFSIIRCDLTNTVPPLVGNAYQIEIGPTYCDASGGAGNTYAYTLTASGSNQPTKTLTASVTLGTGSGGTTTGSSYKPLFGTLDLNTFISQMITWVTLRIGPSLVALMILYAGFEYITSKGNEQTIKAAKDRIFGSVIGFILLMLVGTIMRALFL